MPTENRSSNTEMVSVPRELLGRCCMRPRLETRAVNHQDIIDRGRAQAELREILAQPAPADQHGYPSEDELIANGLGYPISKEDAVKLHYAGYRSEVITILEAWEAIGHDIHINPDKQELMESLRNMAAICAAHGFDMPADPGEVERLRADVETMRNKNNEYWHESEALRAELAELKKGLESQVVEGLRADTKWLRDELDKALLQLAERDTLSAATAKLREAFVIAVGDKSPFAKCALAEIDAALSASAEPSVPTGCDLYECAGKGGEYQIVAVANGAGTIKGISHIVYRNRDGVHFVRDAADFNERMIKIKR